MTFSKTQKVGLVLGPVLFVTILVTSPPESMQLTAWHASAVGILMGILWITEALPISGTALLPIILFPLLGVMDIKEAVKPYAHYLVFLFLGGFLIAQAIQKWNLHKRIAIGIISIIGFNAKKIIIGFMIACAFLSMWISNTATALMMLPIGLSIVSVIGKSVDEEKVKYFTLVLLLSIAYACSIGGVGTLIGTPPNALMAAYMKDNFDLEIQFVEWMFIGVPFIILGLPTVFFVLTKIVYPIDINFSGTEEIILNEKDKLGRITYQEKITASIFAFVALLWMLQPLLRDYIVGMNDTTVAIIGAVVLFLIPSKDPKSKTILTWDDAEKISWGILILFGGGLSLANGIQSSGLAEWLGSLFKDMRGISPYLIVLLIIGLIIFLTELTSNLATTAAFIPVVASVAFQMDIDPIVFVLPATIAASCAFMLPVATPPNAIIFSSGKIKIPEMAKAGIFLNISFICLVFIFSLIVSHFF